MQFLDFFDRFVWMDNGKVFKEFEAQDLNAKEYLKMVKLFEKMSNKKEQVWEEKNLHQKNNKQKEMPLFLRLTKKDIPRGERMPRGLTFLNKGGSSVNQNSERNIEKYSDNTGVKEKTVDITKVDPEPKSE